jgi:hypothetical protein
MQIIGLALKVTGTPAILNGITPAYQIAKGIRKQQHSNAWKKRCAAAPCSGTNSS